MLHAARRHRSTRFVGAGVVLAVLGVEIVLVRPYLGKAFRSLSHPNFWWVLVAVVAELASMAAFARVQRRMLRTGGVRVSMCRMLSLTYAANAVSVTLPAGFALSSGYSFRRLRAWGASVPLAGFTLIASGVLGTVSFGLLCLVAAILVGTHYTTTTLLAGALAVVVLGVVIARRLGHDPQTLVSHAAHLLGRTASRLHLDRVPGRSRAAALLHELTQIRPRKRDWAAGLGFASFNWIADLICLVASCRAVGADHTTITLAVVAYVAGMAVSSISLIPGGLGVVDAAMILTLTHGGLSAASATAGVLLYRLVSFAFIVVIGWVAWAVTWLMDNRRDALAPSWSGQVARPEPVALLETEVLVVDPALVQLAR
jgi:uncharacterized protein (TIRG00374 family)